MVQGRHARQGVKSSRILSCYVLTAIAALACQPPTPDQLHLQNLDGPTSTVFVDGVEVATVTCGESVVVIPQRPQPWEVVVKDAADKEIFRRLLSGSPEQGVLIRSDGSFGGSWPLPGGPAPATICPPN